MKINIDRLISEAKKKGKKVNPWAVCTASIGEKIGSTERSEWTKSQKEKYERCVMDVKKKQGMVKEETINEIGGYDDPTTYAGHSSEYMNQVKDSINYMIESLNELNMLLPDVLDDNLRRSIKNLLSSVENPLGDLKSSFLKASSTQMSHLKGKQIPMPRRGHQDDDKFSLN